MQDHATCAFRRKLRSILGMRNHSAIALIACLALSCASSTSLAIRGEFLDAHYRTEDAGEAFREAMRANNANPKALASLARWYMRQGKAGMAEMLLARACLNPDTTSALRGMKPVKKREYSGNLGSLRARCIPQREEAGGRAYLCSGIWLLPEQPRSRSRPKGDRARRRDPPRAAGAAAESL